MLVISESASNSSEKQKAQPVQLDERLAFDDENEITPEEAQLVCLSLYIFFNHVSVIFSASAVVFKIPV